MSGRRGGIWTGYKLLAVERGDAFQLWTTIVGGGAVWEKKSREDYAHSVLAFKNNATLGSGSALWRLSYALTGITDPAGYTAAHTVHLRIPSHSNRATDVAIGPATALASSVGTGDGYAAIAGFVAGSVVRLIKLTAGATAILATSATGKLLVEGDMLSLAYRWNTSSSRAELAAYINGVLALEFNDTTSPYDMKTLAARVGMHGTAIPSLSNSLQFGHWSTEWWVTDGYAAFGEPRSRYPENVGELMLFVRNRQRFTDNAQPAIQRLISGQVLDASWVVNRIGGCGQMRAQFLYPPVRSGTAYYEHVDAPLWQGPEETSWSSSNWLGGDLVLGVKYQADLTINIASGPNAAAQAMWRGRVARISVDPDTRMIHVEGEGLVKSFDDVILQVEFENAKIRDVIVHIVQQLASKSAQNDGRDYAVRFNASKVVGVQSILDARISAKFNFESARSALEKVMSYLPDGIVWGVDRDGDFYLDQQLDTYDNDMSGAGIRIYAVDRDALSFDRDMDEARIKTHAIVTGRELEPEETNTPTLAKAGRLYAEARCERAEQLFGQRSVVYSEGSIQDIGFAGKVAINQLKRSCFPAITGRLSVVEPIIGDRSFWAALNRWSPRVGVQDRPLLSSSAGEFDQAVPQIAQGFGADQQSIGPYLLRRYGDVEAYSVKARGVVNSNEIVLASNADEQALSKGWLLHVALRFDFAHPGGIGDYSYILGRNDGVSAADYGWGMLLWAKTGASTGRLDWLYRTQSGSSRALSTAISVPPAGGTTVHFTVWRSVDGDWRFYDGTTNTATDSTLQADVLQSSTHPWRFFRFGNSSLPANFLHGDFAMDHWWVLTTAHNTTTALEYQVGTGGVAGFLAANNNSELRRNRTEGLLIYFPFKAQHFGASTIRGWRPGPALASATYVSTNAENGTKITTASRQGQLLQSGSTKRWGGPMIFNCESVRYSVEPGIGVVKKEYTLGEVRHDVYTTITMLRDQVRKTEDSLRRTRRDF